LQEHFLFVFFDNKKQLRGTPQSRFISFSKKIRFNTFLQSLCPDNGNLHPCV